MHTIWSAELLATLASFEGKTTTLATETNSGRPLRVLLVSSKYPPEYSGSGLRAHQTYVRLRRKYGVEVQVIAGSVSASASSQYRLDGIDVSIHVPQGPTMFDFLGPRAKQLANYWRTLIGVFTDIQRRAGSYDVVHVVGANWVTGAAVSYAKMMRCPVMAEVVNLRSTPDQDESRILRGILGRGYSSDAVIVCISERLRQICLDQGYPDSQLWTRPNPVDEARFFFQGQSPIGLGSHFAATSNRDRYIVQIGKFIPLKNQLLSVEAVSRLPDNFKLLLAGPLVTEGEESERDQTYYRGLQSVIESRDLKARVALIPQFIQSPEVLMRQAHVLLMPSTSEAFGTPVAEALACGVPVVASNIPGVFDKWIRDGVNGYICDLDANLWAEKIAAAAEIPRERMKETSIRVLEEASTAVIDKAYYDRLVALSGVA